MRESTKVLGSWGGSAAGSVTPPSGAGEAADDGVADVAPTFANRGSKIQSLERTVRSLREELLGLVKKGQDTSSHLVSDVQLLQQGEVVQRSHGASIKELDFSVWAEINKRMRLQETECRRGSPECSWLEAFRHSRNYPASQLR